MSRTAWAENPEKGVYSERNADNGMVRIRCHRCNEWALAGVYWDSRGTVYARLVESWPGDFTKLTPLMARETAPPASWADGAQGGLP